MSLGLRLVSTIYPESKHLPQTSNVDCAFVCDIGMAIDCGSATDCSQMNLNLEKTCTENKIVSEEIAKGTIEAKLPSWFDGYVPSFNFVNSKSSETFSKEEICTTSSATGYVPTYVLYPPSLEYIANSCFVPQELFVGRSTLSQYLDLAAKSQSLGLPTPHLHLPPSICPHAQ